MAAVTIHSDFGAQENKICHCFHFSSFYFKPAFSLSSFTLIKFLFAFCHNSSVICISEVFIFLPAILIPACDSYSPAFRMMYSAYKLKKQGDNIQPWCTPFPIWNQSIIPCPVLTVVSWPARKLSTKELILLNCGAGGDWRVPWTARRSNQSILRDINPEYSLKELMLNLKLP